MGLTISATDTEVQLPVNVFYSEMFLRQARPLAPYFIGTQPGVLQRNRGTATIKWRRYNTSADNASGISPSVTALSELTGNAAYGQGRTAATVNFSDVTATVAKYGQFYILNEEVQVFQPDGTTAEIVRTLAITGGRSFNQLQRNVAEDNATLIYAGNVASDGVVQSIITAAAINQAVNVLVNNFTMPFTPMATGSTVVGSTPLLPAFWGLCHPDVAYDIANITGFKSVETYAGHTQTVPGEFGAYGLAGFVVRFIQTPEASKETGAGGSVTSLDLNATSGNIDLYTTVIYGQDAIGSVGFGRRHPDGVFRAGDVDGMFELIAKGVGTGRPSSTDDPFDEITTLAYKGWHAGAVLQANYLRGIRSAATNLTN